MKPESMIFDQYSRYRACSDIIRWSGFSEGNSVLDIGSGPECLFGLFMPEASMNYIDPLIPENSGGGKMTGNVFSNELDGKSFGYVSAVDVLEHVPPEYRQSFIDRVSELADNTIILGFPTSDSTDAAAVDNDIEEKYRSIFQRDYSWLDEHFRYGLPSMSETIDQLNKLGWHCQTIGHGHAPWLKELLGFVVCAWDIPFFHKLVLNVSEEFNRKLYAYDFQAPYYRQFIVASREPLPSIELPANAEKDFDSHAVFRSLMEELHQQYFKTSMQAFMHPERVIVDHVRVVKERDDAIAARDVAITERDAAITQIHDIWKSKSWRITRPLRIIVNLYRHGLDEEKKQAIQNELKKRYHQLPLPLRLKKVISIAYHRLFGKVVRIIRRAFSRSTPFIAPLVRPVAQQDNAPDYIMWGVVDWHFRHQRPQQIAQALVNSGRRVFYVSPMMLDEADAGFAAEKIDDSDQLYQIKLFVKGAPSIYASVPAMNEVAQLRASIGEVLDWADSNRTISLVQHPYWYDVAAVMPNSRLVYDCMDHHEGFGNTGESLLQLEKELFSNSDLTITTSMWLNEAVSRHVQRAALIRNACDYQHFSVTQENIYSDTQGRQIIGYYGAIAEWFDVAIIEAVAEKFYDCSVMLIGADTINAKSRLGRLANVKFTGEVPYEQLPFYLHSFDVCLLPFKVVPLTLATNPVKVYEYLSAGKPVVSVDLPEVAQFGDMVYVASDQKDFLEAISNVLSQPEANEIIQKRKNFAAGQTWSHRGKAVIEHAESEIDDSLVSVIVVTYNNLELTKNCLASLQDLSQYENIELIVVDNASSDGSPEFLNDWLAGGSNRKLILNDDNRGFAAANNQGLSIAVGDYLVMLNNDTYVTPGWVRTLVNHLKRDSSIGLIGPVTNNIGNEAKIDIEYDGMDEMLFKSAAYTRRHIGKTYPLRTAAFFCVMMTKKTYDQVGPLDEAFGQGFFEDDDYCRRVEELGLRVVCAEDVFIHHHLSASFNKLKQDDRQKLFEENKRKYEKKWGEWVPHGYRKGEPMSSSIRKSPKVFYGQHFQIGRCNVCGQSTRFYYTDVSLWRESLNCEYCRTTSRYRSISRGILQAIKDFTDISAASLVSLPRSSNRRLRVYDTQPPFYYDNCAYPLPDLLKATGWIDVEVSQYKPEETLGKVLDNGASNQNLESLTFGDATFDIVITSDVMEHVRLDGLAHKEIYRVLKPQGIYLFTVPHNRDWDETLIRVQVNDADDPSKDVHLLEPEYHGDTNSESDEGVLAYRTYGKDLEEYLREIGFTVEYCRDDIEGLGIMNTELYYCIKNVQ